MHTILNYYFIYLLGGIGGLALWTNTYKIINNTKLKLFYLIGGIGETTLGEIKNINHKQTNNEYFIIYKQIIIIN